MKKSFLALAIAAIAFGASAQTYSNSGFIADVGSSSSASAMSGGNGSALSSSGGFQRASVGMASGALQGSNAGVATTSGVTRTDSAAYSVNVTQGNAVAEGGTRGGAVAEVGTIAGYQYLNGTFGEVTGSSKSESSVQVGGGAYQGGGLSANGVIVSNTGAYNSNVATFQGVKAGQPTAMSLTNSNATNVSTRAGGAINIGAATGGQQSTNFGNAFTTAVGTGLVKPIGQASN